MSCGLSSVVTFCQLIYFSFSYSSHHPLELKGQDPPLSSGLGSSHQRMEGRSIQQGGRHLLRGYLLQLEIRPHLGQTHRWHPGVQKAKKDGHHRRFRYILHESYFSLGHAEDFFKHALLQSLTPLWSHIVIFLFFLVSGAHRPAANIEDF